jgi:hypothetical protein
MIRTPAAALLLALAATTATFAQEATTTAPADTQVTVDPNANVRALPKAVDVLTGLYATLATVEICEITLDPAIASAIDADRASMEAAAAFDQPTGEKAYQAVLADVRKTNPDCADGSPDRLGVDAVTAVYASRTAAAPQPAATAPEATPPQ